MDLHMYDTERHDTLVKCFSFIYLFIYLRMGMVWKTKRNQFHYQASMSNVKDQHKILPVLANYMV
jgi:hypothetical protein